MAREACLNCDLCRLCVTNLTHHDDVWVLPEDRPKAARKGKARGLVHLGLGEHCHLPLDGILDGHDVYRSAAAVLEKLGINPVSKSTESALSIFLSRKIPAVTLGITQGENFYTQKATAQIELYCGTEQ